MKKILTLALFFVSASTSAQIKFEKGYFITNEGQRTECLIRNADWKNNPKKFTYKLADSDDPQKATIEAVKEFAVYEGDKFIRAAVKIDISDNDVQQLTTNKAPVWAADTLFLKVLVEGRASLYCYEKNTETKFFYTAPDVPVSQLIYKKYLMRNVQHENDPSKTRDIAADNNTYLTQLWEDVSCSNTQSLDYTAIKYTLKDLEKYFISYNSCFDAPMTVITKPKKGSFNLKVTPGIDIASFSMVNPLISAFDYSFEARPDFHIGIESEFILPYNKSKWGIVFSPEFQNFNFDKEKNDKDASAKITTIDFPIGLRHYFFLNECRKIFLNAFYISKLSVSFKSRITHNDMQLNYYPDNSYSGGIGMEDNRFSAEIRYYAKRKIVGRYLYWDSNLNKFSFLIGYKLFRGK